MAYDYSLLRVAIKDRIASVTIDNPPMNIVTVALFEQLDALSRELRTDPTLSVVVFKSAVEDFFLAHFDVSAILQRPTGGEALRDGQLKPYHAMCERYRTMNKIVIAQIEGRIGGGGSELAASFDMRFGVRGKTIVNQMEVPLGILPGGGGTQRLPRLLGRGRALEVILGGDDLDAETAERWGYLNRALNADEIDAYVDRLARRIGSFAQPAVRLAKESVNAADRPLLEGLAEEALLFDQLLRTPQAKRNMQRFLDIGGQTPAGEREMGELCRKLGEQ